MLGHQRWTTEEMKRANYIKQCCDGHITTKELARLLELSERQAWRVKKKMRSSGLISVRHGNSARQPRNKTPLETRNKILEVFLDWKRETDEGLNASHLCDILKRDHNIKVSRWSCWRLLKQQSLFLNTRRVRKHRKKRDRREQEGDLLYLDGSPHRWFGEKYPKATLLLCTDDATSKALGAMFVQEENRNGCFEVTYNVMKKYGLPRSFWLDRASQFITTRGEGVCNKQSVLPTHWQNAMYELGVRLIFANSPQARGRGERANGTFQDRLAAELQYRKIRTLEGGTKFLNEVFIPEYNERFAVPASNSVTAWRSIPKDLDLRCILAARDSRKVLNDNTVKHDGVRYQLLQKPGVRTFARDEVEVQEWYDGTFHVVHPRYGDLKYEAKREFDGHRRIVHPDIIAATTP